MTFHHLVKKKKRVFERKHTNRVTIRDFLDDELLHLVRDLEYHEILYLLNHGYVSVYQQDLHGKKDYYLIQPPLNESIQHCFLVQIVLRVLRNNFEDVKEFRTREPDIVFRVRNRFIALEIETGKVLNKNKKRFLEKVRTLNENYGDDWFIVVTNRNLVGRYRVFGKTITRKNLLKKLSSYVDFDID